MYSETSDLVKVSFNYDEKYDDEAYLKRRSLELYNQAYDETYTPLYGVLPGYVEFNMEKDREFKTSKSNPFS